MKKLPLLLAFVLTIIGVFIAQPSEAVLNWDWDFTNSGATYSPTDSVSVLAKLINNSTEGETIGGFIADYYVTQSSLSSSSPLTNPFPAYDFGFGPNADGLFFEQFDGLALTPGNSFDFTVGVFDPGTGAPTGDYALNGGLSLAKSGEIAARQQGSELSIQDKPYNWQVAGEIPPSAVPEPMTMVLLGAGMVGSVLLKRKSA